MQLLINKKNIIIYHYILEKFEGCQISVRNDSIIINKKFIDNYAFKYNYYFVLDDNRDNAKDSRLWGFLPETHIIGKVSIIFASFDLSESGFSKIRWSRILKIPGK